MDEVIDCKQYTTDVTPELWKELEPLVTDAARYAHWEFMAEDVLEALKDGRQQIWVVRADGKVKFTWVTEILQQSGRRVVVVFAAAGESAYGWQFWPWMSQWMIGNNITEAEVFCRPSMARLLRRFGLETRFEVMRIEPVRIV